MPKTAHFFQSPNDEVNFSDDEIQNVLVYVEQLVTAIASHKKEALAQGSKLVLVLSENHLSKHSLFNELLILVAFKLNGGKQVFLEGDKNYIQQKASEKIQSRSFLTINTSYLIDLINYLQLRYAAAEDNHLQGDQAREKSMVQHLRAANDHGVLIVGTDHVNNIVNSLRKLDDIYTLVFDTDNFSKKEVLSSKAEIQTHLKATDFTNIISKAKNKATLINNSLTHLLKELVPTDDTYHLNCAVVGATEFERNKLIF